MEKYRHISQYLLTVICAKLKKTTDFSELATSVKCTGFRFLFISTRKESEPFPAKYGFCARINDNQTFFKSNTNQI